MTNLYSNSELYKKIDNLPINGAERAAAKESLRRADVFIDAVVWVADVFRKVAAEYRGRSSLKDKITAA
jgi:hypothetical protein